MNALALLPLAIFPGVAISWYIYAQDKHEKEPHRILLLSFFIGMLTTIPAIFLEEIGVRMGFDASDNILITAIFTFVVVGGSEEWVKYLGVRYYSFARDAFNEPMDGIVYSVMVSMGFATLENILYVMQLGFGTGVLRMFTAVPAHAAFAVIMGYYMGLAKFDPDRRTQLLMTGLVGAIILHGAYDFFLFQRNFPALALLAFVCLGLGIYYSRKLIKLHQKNSPFKDGLPVYDPEPPFAEEEALDDDVLGYLDDDEPQSDSLTNDKP